MLQNKKNRVCPSVGPATERLSHAVGIAVVALTVAVGAGETAPKPTDYFAIRVVDEQTGRGVPLVGLRTVNDVVHVTDSNGLVAFSEPGLMGRRVFFHVFSHGYEFPKDRFGQRGRALMVTPGREGTLRIRRRNIAERLYRVTGAGIFRDTILLGRKPPIRQPLLNGLVLGQDSVLNVVYRGKLHWFWGDTNRPGHPLGNFHVPGATSRLPAGGGLDPSVGVNLTYFLDNRGFAKPTCRMPGKGPTWLTGLVVLPDATGRRRMLGAYVKIRNRLEAYERGIVAFNDALQQFEKVCSYPPRAAPRPDGHTFTCEAGGVRYVYFATAWPLVRVRATVEDYTNLEAYEAYTCLTAGSAPDKPRLDRDAGGRLRYSWKRGTAPLWPKEQRKLIKAGLMQPAEELHRLLDIETGDAVRTQHGSVYYNAFRQRWVMIVSQTGGKTSFLGEVWYAEGDTPTGPWLYARRIITHDKYSFYNPRHHPMFDESGGRVIYLEGTYTKTFSGRVHATPRYDYNQIMYRLDLADERLALPVPVYASADGRWATLASRPDGHETGQIAFFALDRPKPGVLGVWQERGDRVRVAAAGKVPPGRAPAFYALPPDADAPNTAPLLETTSAAGTHSYVVAKELPRPEAGSQTKRLCRVWSQPLYSLSP